MSRYLTPVASTSIFLGSTDAGPVKNWFDQSNTDMEATFSIYVVTLDEVDAKSPPERKR